MIIRTLTYELCKEIALKYATIRQLRKEDESVYMKINKQKWSELLDHMTRLLNPHNYWSYDRCKQEAIKYNNLTIFRKEQQTAAHVIYSNHWVQLLQHMSRTKHANNYWTYDRCKEEALKYTNKRDFRQNAIRASNAIYKNKWYELWEHMDKLSTLKERYIYAFEFNDNHVYIGLSWNPKQRYAEHLNNKTSKVFIHIKNTQSKFNFKVITKKPVPENIAGNIEKQTLKRYKDKGWIILNKATTGGLGASKILWTYDKCKQEAIKYNTITELYKNLKHVVGIMKKNGWFKELTSHITYNKKNWNNFDDCKQEALKYNNKLAFQRKCSGAYKAAKRNGWFDQITTHMPNRKNLISYEECIELTKQSTSFKELKIKNKSVYLKIVREGWKQELVKHIKTII